MWDFLKKPEDGSISDPVFSFKMAKSETDYRFTYFMEF
jgi:hypothetical protein